MSWMSEPLRRTLFLEIKLFVMTLESGTALQVQWLNMFLFCSWFVELRPRERTETMTCAGDVSGLRFALFHGLKPISSTFRGVTFGDSAPLLTSRDAVLYLTLVFASRLEPFDLMVSCSLLFLFVCKNVSMNVFYICTLYGTVPAHDAPISTCEVTAHALLRLFMSFLCGPASADPKTHFTDPEWQTALSGMHHFFTPDH